MTYITVAEMDALGIAEWDALSEPEQVRAVAQANAYLSARRFIEWETQPDAITLAAQELALLAGEGKLYADATTGVIARERVRAGSVETETAYEGGATATRGVIQYVEDLIRPYLSSGQAAFEVRRA